MSNRNFDNRVIIQRLQQQTYARNLYQTNMNGQSLISNPQNSDGTSSRLTTFVSGAQTDYFRGLIGAGETISLGGIFGISPFIIPTVTIPGPPRITEITDGNTQLTVAFVAPLSGGSAITGYKYSIDNGATFAPVIPADRIISPITITGLTNGTTYQVVIRAVNQIGVGPYSNMVEGTPATVPGPPAITGITDGNTQLTVAFTPPTSTGGSAITGYQYSIDSSGNTFIPIGDISGNTFTIIGLTNGTLYTVVMRAVNRIGDSVDSNSASGTPATVPGPPTILTPITEGNTQLTVAFTASASTGGSVIQYYEYSKNGGAFTSIGSTVAPFTITGLTNGTPYTVVMRAHNRMGDSVDSRPASGTPATVPDAPTGIAITDGNQQLTVAFIPPATGGSVITGYQYVVNNDSYTCAGLVTDISGNTFIITGLTNGTSYGVFISAVNRMGNGTHSNTEPGTPATVPSRPTINTPITAGNTTLTVTFTAPTSDGGSPITDYQYSSNNGISFTPLGPTVVPFTITGLTNGTSYSVIIKAINRMGNTNSDSVSATPVGPPSKPIITGITAGNTTLSVTFTAPADGGSPITDYQYSSDDGSSFTSIGTRFTSFTITGLTNGTSYTIIIKAINNLGNTNSDPESATPVGPPGAPTITGITELNTTLSVTFAAPASDGGSPITGYQYSSNNGSSFTSIGTTVAPFTITGLTNNTSYTIIIKAINNLGNTDSNPVPAKPQSSGPNVFQGTIQGEADTYTIICTKFTSFEPTTASILYNPRGQFTALRIDNSGTTTNMVMADWSYQNMDSLVDMSITFSNGILTSSRSNTFNWFDILVL